MTQSQEDLCLNPKLSDSQFTQTYSEANNTWFTEEWEINTIKGSQTE